MRLWGPMGSPILDKRPFISGQGVNEDGRLQIWSGNVLGENQTLYPLVMTNIAMENHHF